MKRVFWFLQGVLLSGCNVFPHPESDYFHNKYWTKGREQPMQMVYCYSTLGDHQCTREPIPGKEHLLVSDQALIPGHNRNNKENHNDIASENLQRTCFHQEKEDTDFVESPKVCANE